MADPDRITRRMTHRGSRPQAPSTTAAGTALARFSGKSVRPAQGDCHDRRSFTALTLLMVTHEMSFARDVCSRVVFMHQGRVHEIGPPGEVFGNPQTPELRQFLDVG